MNQLKFETLRDANTTRSVEWCGASPNMDDLEFLGLELGGEAGEVLNELKKIARFIKGWRGGKDPRDPNTLAKLAEELADVVICADRAAIPFGIDLAQAVIDKFNKTSEQQNLQTKLSESE